MSSSNKIRNKEEDSSKDKISGKVTKRDNLKEILKQSQTKVKASSNKNIKNFEQNQNKNLNELNDLLGTK